VLPRITIGQIAFAEPIYLWLLVVPALLAVLWLWRLAARRRDRRRLTLRRTVPIREVIGFAGDLPFWLCLIAALAVTILAVARPRGPATVVRQTGLDLVILQDASASMRVKDVQGDRWQRSMAFLRTVANSLSWRDDRIAMAVFARVAAPQVRLTRDPNTFFFFLDNLSEEPPFPLYAAGTWDTNLERGLHWGLRLIERDEERHGRSPNARLVVMISDGQAWSGEIEASLQHAASLGVPVFAVGVGTLGGGPMPVYRNARGEVEVDPETPLRARLDRTSLQRIAAVGGGRYFELDRDGDRQIANALIDFGKRLAPTVSVTEEAEDLYWYFLCVAAAIAAAGLFFLREPAELWLQLAGAALALIAVTAVLS
jgi:Ca-activated chloride channel family protein